MRISLDSRWRSLTLITFLSLGMLSCGGGPGSGPPPISVASGNVYSFVSDAPPPGSTILKFEITLNSATLCPQLGPGGECLGAPQVALINAPVEIELNQLQLQSAFLSLKTVTAGTFAGVRLTFASPQLKLLAADGTIQSLEGVNLPINPTSVSPTFSGGLTISGNSNTGLLIDFNVLDSIQSSGNTVTGISPVVQLVKVPASTQQPIEELEDTTGRVTNLTKTCPTGTFSLIDSLTGFSVANIRFDGTTEFEDSLTCATLANDQVVEVDLVLRSPTQQSAEFFAKKIELKHEPNEDGLEGLVFQVNSATQFVLLVEDETGLANVPRGSFVTLNFNPQNVQFRLDADNLPVQSSAFASGADLLAGQKLEVDVVNNTVTVGTTGCDDLADNCAASVDKIKLKKSTVTGRVAGTSDPNFTLTNLPAIFGTFTLLRRLSADCQACAAGSITVGTSSQTAFEDGLSSFSNLAVGQIVAVRGLLIKNGFAGPAPTGAPQLIAQKVRLRTP